MTTLIADSDYDFRGLDPFTLAFHTMTEQRMDEIRSECPIERATSIYVEQDSSGDSSGGSGSGTKADPYLVDDLDALRTFVTNNVAEDTRLAIRGTFQGKSGLVVTQDNATVQLGWGGIPGIITSFYAVDDIRAGAWSNTAGTEYEVELTRSFLGGGASGYPIVAMNPIDADLGIPCSVWDGAADVDDDLESHLELSGSGDTLTIDIGDDHTTADVYLATGAGAGIILSGDGTTLYMEGAESGFRGWGSFQGVDTAYCVYVGTASGGVTRIIGGTTAYGHKHNIGCAGSASSRCVLIENHHSAYTMNASGGQTVYVMYADSGGEFYCVDCTCSGGTIKGDYISATAVGATDGSAFFSHSGGSDNTLCVLKNFTVTNSAESQIADFAKPWNMGDLPNGNPYAGDLITAQRGFVIDSYANIPEGSSNNAWNYCGTWVSINNRFNTLCTGTTTNVKPIQTGTTRGWAANDIWELDFTGANPTSNAGLVEGNNASNTESMVLEHLHIKVTEPAADTFKLDAIARNISTHMGDHIRLINSIVDPQGSGSTPSVNVRNAAPSTGAGLYGGLVNNLVNTSVRQADGTSYWGVDNSVGTITVANASMPAVGYEPESGDDLYQAGSNLATVEFDRNWTIRSTTSPSIGPIEQAETISMARLANSATAASDATANILSGNPALKVTLKCASGSAAPLKVRVRNKDAEQSIHDEGDWYILAAGESAEFEASLDNPINSVVVQGNSGTATYSWTVVHA